MYLADGHSEQFLTKLVKHFKDTKVAEIKSGHIRSACRVIYPKAKPATWNRQVITPARAVINNVASKDMAPYIKVEMFPELRAVRSVPADDWLQRFIEKAMEEKRPRLAAIALFTRITGARIGQAINLTWKAVDLQNATAIIPPAKGFPERRAELTPQMVAMLANLRGERRGQVFGYMNRASVYNPWKRICRLAEIPYITSHLTGRRGFFTTMARSGHDVKTAMENGGMKSSRLAVEIYTEARKERGLISSVFGTFESQSLTAKSKKHRRNGHG